MIPEWDFVGAKRGGGVKGQSSIITIRCFPAFHWYGLRRRSALGVLRPFVGAAAEEKRTFDEPNPPITSTRKRSRHSYVYGSVYFFGRAFCEAGTEAHHRHRVTSKCESQSFLPPFTLSFEKRMPRERTTPFERHHRNCRRLRKRRPTPGIRVGTQGTAGH